MTELSFKWSMWTDLNGGASGIIIFYLISLKRCYHIFTSNEHGLAEIFGAWFLTRKMANSFP